MSMKPLGLMTQAEMRLYKESIIRQYKTGEARGIGYLLRQVRNVTPFKIIVGLVASAGVVYIKGWGMLFYLVLSGILWLTFASSFLSKLAKGK